MNLKNLNRIELDQKMKSLALRERELLSEVLLVIKEIDGRRLFLDMGFPNLFSYLVSLGYSEGATQRRIDAARLLNDVPTLNKQIETGVVNLSQISLMQKAFREAKKQSKKISKEDKITLLEQVSRKTYHETQATIAQFLDLPIQQVEVKNTQKDESVRVTLTLSKEIYEKINRAQELLSHSLPNKELAAYLEFVSDKVIQQKTTLRKLKGSTGKTIPKTSEVLPAKTLSRTDGQARGLNTVESQQEEMTNLLIQEPEFTATSAVNFPPAANTKNLSARIRKHLHRTQQTCQFKDPITGKSCRSSWRVQVDHRKSQWAGGDHQAKNLQLLCRAHNIYKYKSEMNISYQSS